jgi:hypothetical protein
VNRPSERSAKPALMTPAQATQLLEHMVHDRVREVIDFCGLLCFEQELWRALVDCGVPRELVPKLAAEMLAQGLTKVGEHHIKAADNRVVMFDQHGMPTGEDGAS